MRRNIIRGLGCLPVLWFALSLTAVPAYADDLGLSTAPADAGMLGQHNSRVLANKLATASAQQGICYGWDITLEDNWRSYTTTREVGSNLGVGVDPRRAATCSRWVVFVADIVWTSSSSESPDSATFSLQDNFRSGITTDDLRRLGVTEESLLGDYDVRTVYNAVVALPQLVAAHSGDVPAPSPQRTRLPGSNQLVGSPGSDFFRSFGTLTLWAAGLVVVGAGWLIYSLFSKRGAGGTGSAYPQQYSDPGPASHPYPPQQQWPPQPGPQSPYGSYGPQGPQPRQDPDEPDDPARS